MITCMQGTMGSGKSATCVAIAVNHLRQGGVVAANFALDNGWSDAIAERSLWSRFDDEYRHKLSSDLWNRFYQVNSLDAILKLNPKELATGKHKEDGSYKEGQGLLILDECQLIFNSRKWEKNFQWIQFFTQSRKRGWDVLLVAHSIEMIDSQIRPLCELAATFRNLQKIRIPFLGLPLSPFPSFLMVRRYAGLGAGSGVIHSRDVYPLPVWAAKLYDSTLVFSEDSWGKDQEPRLCGNPPAPPLGGGAGEQREARRQSYLGDFFKDLEGTLVPVELRETIQDHELSTVGT